MLPFAGKQKKLLEMLTGCSGGNRDDASGLGVAAAINDG